MILYVNGCSHTAAAEAVVPAVFAIDDGRYGIDRRPHPLNLEASWGRHLSRMLNAEFYCDAETAASNDRILRTTTDYIKNNYERLYDTVMVIQWTTWEREEWLYQGTYYQVNASGIDMVPPELEARYRKYIVDVDWTKKTDEWHNKIWHLHCQLQALQVRHVFYSGNSTFSDIPNQRDWQNHYIQPYSREHSWHAILKNNGFEHVNPKSYHFGADGHRFWSEYVLHYLKQHKLLDRSNEISTD